MTPIEVPLQRLPHGAGLPLPSYATADAAGLDLVAAVAEAIELAPGARRLVPTGISIALPRGYEAQLRPRSGLALKHGVTLLNSPGTIDADYRGEVGVREFQPRELRHLADFIEGKRHLGQSQIVTITPSLPRTA